MSFMARSDGDVSIKVYWTYWNSLEVKDGVLYKKWETPNLKKTIFQLIVPRKLIAQILEELIFLQ